MAIKFGMTVADMILQLTRGFMKATGRKPDGLEKIKIKQEANQRFKDQQKVVDMEGRILDPSKSITGGTQEGAALKSGIMKMTGAKPRKVKTEKEIEREIREENQKGLDSLKQKLEKEKRRTQRISGNLRLDNMQRTKIGKPKLDEDEYDYYRELLDDDENNIVMGDETRELLEAMVKEQQDEIAYMRRLYDKGALDPPEDMADGGRIGFFKGAQADTKKGKSMSPGTDTKGNVRDDNPFTGGGGDTPTDDDKTFIEPPKVDIKNIRKNPYSNLNTPMGVAALSPAILARIARMGKKIKPIFGGDVGLEYADEAEDATTNFKIIQDIEDLIKEKKLNPELKYKKEIGDNTLIEGGINKKGDANIFFKKKFDNLSDIFRFGKADGGRIGLKKGMDRRTFMKIMGGLTTLPVLGKFFKGAEVAAPVAEKAVQAAKSVPPYFLQLAEQIKTLGASFDGPVERVKQYIMKSKDGKSELMLTEDLGTGEMQIKKIGKENDDMVTEVQTMEFTPGMVKADETTKGIPKDNYEEYTEYQSRIQKDEFNDPDIVDGIDVEDISKELKDKFDVEQEILEQVSKETPSIKKASGGIARMLGE